MRSTSSLRMLTICSVCFVALLAAAPAEAADVTLRVQGQATTSDGDVLGLGDELETAPGAYLGVEWRLNERLGVEAGVGWMELEQTSALNLVILAFDTTATLTVMPVTVALDVHLTPNSRYDLYLAPRIGWALFDDLEFSTEVDFSGFPGVPGIPGLPGVPLPPLPNLPNLPAQTTPLALEDQFVYGLRLGFDVPFGKSAWSFTSSLDLLGVDLELEDGPGLGVALDPISVGLGIGYRF